MKETCTWHAINKRLVMLIWVQGIVFSGAYPQPSSWPVEILDISKGLSQNTILSVFQDHEGFMWFGTYDGLNCYNGKTFTVYRPHISDSASLSSNFIKAITEDDEGLIYIGTINGLNILNRNDDSFKRLTGGSQNGGLGTYDAIHALVRDSDGKIWIAASSGVFLYDPVTREFLDLPVDPFNQFPPDRSAVFCLLQSNDGSLWIGTQYNGVYRLQGQTLEHFRTEPGNRGISSNTVLSLYQDTQGHIWIGTTNGLNRYDPVEKRMTRYLNALQLGTATKPVQITCMIETSKHDFLAAAMDYPGLYRFNRVSGDFETLTLFEVHTGKPVLQSFYSIYEDKSGLLWLGTAEGGILKIKLSKKPFHIIKPEIMGSSSIFSLMEDSRGLIWMGMRQGIAIWDRKTGNFETLLPGKDLRKNLSGNRIWGLAEDRHGYIWISTANGLNRYHPREKTFIQVFADSLLQNGLVDNTLYSLHFDRTGQLWIGSSKGLSRYNPVTGSFKTFRHHMEDKGSLAGNIVVDIYQDSKDRIWIATHNGLSLYLPESESFRTYRNDPANPESLSHNYILSVMEDKDGFIWIGTNGYGLDRLDISTGRFINFSMVNGLPNNTVYDVQEVNGFLWMSTNNGLARLNKGTGTVTVYNENDGLVSNEFNPPSLKTREGQLLFGSVRGVTGFFPDSIHPETYHPPLVFTDLKINNSSVRPGQTILHTVPIERSINKTGTLKIHYKIRSFTLEYATLEFNSSEKIRYRYKIDEFKDTWIDNGQHDFITLTGLTPGTYHLSILGTNADGIWAETPRTLRIMILTPWWKTRPFYLLLLFTVTGVTVFLIRYRTWKLKRDKEVLEQLVRTRTMEVENQKEQIRRQNEMLLQHGEKLEELVAERTKALTAAMEKAEESNRLKTAFLQNLSHEIRTPLNAIMGFSELLNNTDNSDEERNSYTHIIVNSSRQLLSIMHNILTISSIETGQEKMEKSVVLINGIVEETVQLFKNAADTKGIALRIEHPSSGYETQPIRASTDGYKLQQILLHLINNAIKYTHVGSVSVAYGLEGNRITFRITDTGIGIPPQQIDHIFDRFRKGDDPLTSEARGTGLGLSISKAYVELLGGTIRVTSEPGKGSSFYFTITPG